MRYSEQEAKIRRDAMRDEEFELLFGEGTQGPATGIEPSFSWNADANKRNIITYYNKHIKANEFDDIPLPDKSGMLSGMWDKLKGVGESLFTDNEYRQEFEDNWLKILGYKGMPRLEMYKGEDAEAEFDRDSREYWDTHPDTLSKY